MYKRSIMAGLLSALLVGGIYAITHCGRSTVAPETPPPRRATIPFPDIQNARMAVAASKDRLRVKLEDEEHPEHAQAVEFVRSSEEAVKKLESLSNAVAAFSSDPSPAASAELMQQFESTITAVENVRDQAETADPESKSFWDKLLDALLWVLKNIVLPLFAEWVKGQATDGGNSSSGGSSGSGSTTSYLLADATIVGTSDGGRLMLALGNQVVSLSSPEANGRAVGLHHTGGTFPLIVEWQRPDGARLDYEYASASCVPVVRHGK